MKDKIIKVKLSTLTPETIVLVDSESTVRPVADILDDLEYYRETTVYTTKPRHANFDAKYILDNAIENEYQNMYEDWDESISADVTDEDIADLQKIFDRILARGPVSNIVYVEDKPIEIDL